MPIQLTTPYSLGSADPTAYQKAKILQFTVMPEGNRIELTVQKGNIIDGVWQNGIGIEGKTILRYTIEDPDYSTLVAEESEASGEVYYSRVSDLLYSWLMAHDPGNLAGTVV